MNNIKELHDKVNATIELLKTPLDITIEIDGDRVHVNMRDTSDVGNEEPSNETKLKAKEIIKSLQAIPGVLVTGEIVDEWIDLYVRNKTTESMITTLSTFKKQMTIDGILNTNEVKMDKVGGEDIDINNDKKVDKNDFYLLNRRRKIKQAMKKEGASKEIKDWTDKEVETAYKMYLDELSKAEKDEELAKKLTVDQKRKLLIKQENNFRVYMKKENVGMDLASRAIQIAQDFDTISYLHDEGILTNDLELIDISLDDLNFELESDGNHHKFNTIEDAHKFFARCKAITLAADKIV